MPYAFNKIKEFNILYVYERVKHSLGGYVYQISYLNTKNQ